MNILLQCPAHVWAALQASGQSGTDQMTEVQARVIINVEGGVADVLCANIPLQAHIHDLDNIEAGDPADVDFQDVDCWTAEQFADKCADLQKRADELKVAEEEFRQGFE